MQQQQQQFCLKWNNFSQHLRHAFSSTWSGDDLFTDVVLATCYGERVRAHRMVLSACSNLFSQLLVDVGVDVEPVLILHDVSVCQLRSLVHFMYHGEVNVQHDAIPALLRAAENLQIRGLCATPSVAPPATLDIPDTPLLGSSSLTKRSRACVDSGRYGNKRHSAEAPSGASLANKRQRIGRAVAAAPDLPSPATASYAGDHTLSQAAEVVVENPYISEMTDGVGSEADHCEARLRIDENSNGLESEPALDEQDDYSVASSGGGGDHTSDEQFFPLPRASHPLPPDYSALSRLSTLAVKLKLVPRHINELETAIVSSMPRTVDYTIVNGCFVDASASVVLDINCRPPPLYNTNNNNNGSSSNGDDSGGGVAFHEPRHCRHCGLLCRDASTLRTHTTLMHTEGLDPFVCSCGSLFRTKHAMCLHKRQGHPALAPLTAV